VAAEGNNASRRRIRDDMRGVGEEAGLAPRCDARRLDGAGLHATGVR
jgi:hypothetical protein